VKSAITIANYEEFFLLYADNELSAQDRKTVEEFVQANPGLAVELEMLRQVQLLDEPLVFGNKETLYRKESEEINLANYEEHFLLLVDNELAPGAKEKVETFVLQHPAVQEGFTLLKQTKLGAETLVFPDKKSLYRKEEKERPVFYLRWQRIAVAAAFIGLAVLVWNVLPRDKDMQQHIAQATKGNIPGASQKNAGIDPSKNNGSNSGAEAGKHVDAPAAQTAANNNGAGVGNGVVRQDKNTGIASSNINNSRAVTGEQIVGTNNSVVASIEPPAVRTVESARVETVMADSHNGFQTAVTSTQSVTADRSALENHAIAANSTEAITGGPNNNEVQPAVYRELDTEDEKKSLLLGSLEINKDKLRGFFRKAGNIFRSKSKTEDEKTESRPPSSTRSLK
jgi:hypothetical protein